MKTFLLKIRCFVQGHDWKKIKEEGYCYDPAVCVEQHNPFALTTCHVDVADVVQVTLKCQWCGKLNKYEA